MLWARDLSHAFGAIRALDGITFSLNRGQTLVIFGPNGAGKTTLLRVIAGLIRPRRGTAGVDGGRRAIGWIGTSPLYGQLTVRRTSSLGVALRRHARRTARARRRLDQRLGLEQQEHQPVRTCPRPDAAGGDRAGAS
jgi:ABC-type multidrug transport system ATPase subunit